MMSSIWKGFLFCLVLVFFFMYKKNKEIGVVRMCKTSSADSNNHPNSCPYLVSQSAQGQIPKFRLECELLVRCKVEPRTELRSETKHRTKRKVLK